MKTRTYGISMKSVGPERVPEVFSVLADLLADQLVTGLVDAIPSGPFREKLPGGAMAALHELQARGKRRTQKKRSTLLGRLHSGDPAMGIELHLTDQSDFDLFREFGPYSIYAAAYPVHSPDPLLKAVDGGDWILFEAEDDIVSQLVTETGMDASAIEAARPRI